MSNKRYYWLKLNDNFFEDDTIVWLEEQENGKDYVIFYLKLLLKSLKEEGTLVRYVGERLMPYDTNSLAKLTNTPVDTVRVAMQLFIEFGLVKQMDAGELYLTQIDEMIGSETRQAGIMRKKRALENAKKEEEVTLLQNVTPMLQNVKKSYTEIEIDIELEKELEKEKEKAKKEKDERFNEFWKEYPNKKNKKKAKDKYLKDVDKELHQIIMNDLNVRKKSKDWTKEDGRYIPHPTTYLNGERWNDEVETNDYTDIYKTPIL